VYGIKKVTTYSRKPALLGQFLDQLPEVIAYFSIYDNNGWGYFVEFGIDENGGYVKKLTFPEGEDFGGIEDNIFAMIQKTLAALQIKINQIIQN
jgi:hypothetical protein